MLSRPDPGLRVAAAERGQARRRGWSPRKGSGGSDHSRGPAFLTRPVEDERQGLQGPHGSARCTRSCHRHARNDSLTWEAAVVIGKQTPLS